MSREVVVAPEPRHLVEKLADAEHASWANWMSYLFSQCETGPLASGGTLSFDIGRAKLIPEDSVDHWHRQIVTSYEFLTDEEKESDRKEVYKILPVIAEYVYNWLTIRGFEFSGPEDAAQAFLEELRGYAHERGE